MPITYCTDPDLNAEMGQIHIPKGKIDCLGDSLHGIQVFSDAAWSNGRACLAGVAKKKDTIIYSWLLNCAAYSAAQIESKVILTGIFHCKV